MTLEELEAALDKNKLEVQWRNGKWYSVRRNGQTKRWKLDSERFRIPCKSGFKDYFAIAAYSCDGNHTLNSPYIRIKS